MSGDLLLDDIKEPFLPQISRRGCVCVVFGAAGGVDGRLRDATPEQRINRAFKHPPPPPRGTEVRFCRRVLRKKPRKSVRKRDGKIHGGGGAPKL